jgi:EmrB/QacA subfamily drug resistance transporter
MWALFREPCEENLIRAQPAVSPCTKTRGRWILAATILASSMAFIDSTVVNVALPALQTNLGATAQHVQWVVEAYSLTLSAFLLVGGSLGDHYGRRRIFIIGIAIFTFASAICGLAGNIAQLIAARALQGLGAALLVPGSLAIISNSFPEEQRGRAIGTWSGYSAITTGLGPILGGWLIEHVSWRAVFFINLPIALAVIAISLRYIPHGSEKEKSSIDWLGAGLVALGLGALVYGLIESSTLGFGRLSVSLSLLVATILLLAFLWVESRLRQPMLPLGLFRSRTFAGTNLLTFLLYAALGGTLFFLPLNLIQIQHYSPSAAGAALLPFILIISFLSRWSGGLVMRYGPKLPLMIGPLIAAFGYALFIRADIGHSYWIDFFPPITLIGLGMAITVPPLTTSVMGSVSQQRAGIASGVNNAVTRTAGMIAIAVLGIVMLQTFKNGLDRRLANSNVPSSLAQSLRSQSSRLAALSVPKETDSKIQHLTQRAIDESFLSGFRAVMLIGAFLAMASAVSALAFLKGGRTKTIE